MRARCLRFGIGLLFVLAAAVGIAYPLFWEARSSAGGRVLLDRAQVSQRAPTACPRDSVAAATPTSSAPGVLEIPAIHLVAPVENGLSDNVLNVAVGHDEATPWPTGSGEAILEAHDVSYFSNLQRLRAGEEVIWVTRCVRSVFTVDSESILEPGDLVFPPKSGAGLSLVTCYPTNALFWTSERFVVNASLAKVDLTAQTVPSTAQCLPQLTVPAPPALVNEGLQLDQNSLLLGVLRFEGSPSASWTAGPDPLIVERDALEAFFGAEKAVVQQNHLWWTDLTVPGLAFRATWPSFGQTNISITVDGTTPRSVTMSSGSSSVTVVIHGRTVLVSNVS